MHYLDNKVFDITDARCSYEDYSLQIPGSTLNIPVPRTRALNTLYGPQRPQAEQRL